MQKRYKILITGSSGMLGIDLCQELEGKYDIYGIDLRQSAAYELRHFGRCDITDKDRVDRAISKAGPDIVVHAAAWTDVDGCELDAEMAHKINSDGTKNIAFACKKNKAVLVYVSTDFVFDGKKKEPYKESDKPNPISIYGNSKLKGEDFIRKNLKKYFIIRTSWLYGKHGKNFVDTIVSKSKAEKELKVVDDQTGSPTYTKDLSKALHVLLDKFFTGYGTYHISNSGSVSWYGYAAEILRLAKSETKVTPISSKELARPAKRPAMSVLDNSKFVKLTGYKMRSWNEALKEYLCENERGRC